jgi:hypothetical protein
MGRKRNRRLGSAITETGPALFLLLILIFFPLTDVCYMLAGYMFAYFLHNTEARECSVRKPDNNQAANYIQIADDDFYNHAGGMAAFLRLTGSNRFTKISHNGPVYTAGAAGPGTMSLTTRVLISPWFYLPLCAGIPGLGADMPVSFTTNKPQEESGSDDHIR